MRSPTRYARSGTTLIIGTMGGAVTWASRFEAPRRTCSARTVNAVSSGIRPSSRSPGRRAVARPTTKWPSWSATPDSLDRERQMIAAINRGIGAFDRLGGDHAFVASDRLRPEQQHAVHQVLASRDWAVSLRGAAGTGKTATLQELHRGLAESRH